MYTNLGPSITLARDEAQGATLAGWLFSALRKGEATPGGWLFSAAGSGGTGQSGVILAALCRDELQRLREPKGGRADAPPAPP
ncbi:MAG TPA: hypothetical protein VF858_04080, partial [Gemmatimonadaceae bacterium]